MYQYPDPDVEYILDTEARSNTVGSGLAQVKDCKEGVVAYFSKIFLPGMKLLCHRKRTAGRRKECEILQALPIRTIIQTSHG